MKNTEITEIDRLDLAKQEAWRAYEELSGPASEAYKKYEAARDAHKDAVLYEKVRRKVVRDLINSAGEKANV